MPVPVKRAMLDDIKKNKLSHDKKQSKTNISGHLVFDNKLEKGKSYGKVEDDIRPLEIETSLVSEKIVPEVKALKEDFVYSKHVDGSITLEKCVEVDVIEGDEPEIGVEVIVKEVTEEQNSINFASENIARLENKKILTDLSKDKVFVFEKKENSDTKPKTEKKVVSSTKRPSKLKKKITKKTTTKTHQTKNNS